MALQSNFNWNGDYRNEWISKKITEPGIEYLENFGFYLCDKKTEQDRLGYAAVTTSQLRNIFSEVKRIEIKIDISEDKEGKKTSNWDALASDVLLLRPKIAYNTARVVAKQQNSRMKDLRTILEKALQSVKEPDDFVRFSQFMEGIIAYHKVYGGRD
jgi:CRISPR-associated protein Csm2